MDSSENLHLPPLDRSVISIMYKSIIEQASGLSAKDWSNYGCPNPILSIRINKVINYQMKGEGE